MALRVWRAKVRSEKPNAAAKSLTLVVAGKDASMCSVSCAINALPCAIIAGTMNGDCSCRPSISRARPTASVNVPEKRLRSRCSIRSIWPSAAPAVIKGESSITMRSGFTLHVGASHHEVVTRRSSSRPAACSTKTAEHDAATSPPASTWARTRGSSQAMSGCSRRCSISST
ncbi:hypothetical protein D3C77_513830 [compost metagenome]